MSRSHEIPIVDFKKVEENSRIWRKWEQQTNFVWKTQMERPFMRYSIEIPSRCSFVMEFIIPKFFKGSTCFEQQTAHHQELQTVFVASGLYAHMVTGRCQGWVGTQCPLSLGNGRSPYGHINQRLQIQFGAPDDERSAAQNMLSL